MKLTVLGSGSSVPHPRRSSAGFWLEAGAKKILLDCSASVPLRMAQENVDWPELDAIWISHFHIDHCAGLLPLLAGVKHSDRIKGRTKPLRIWGPSGIKNLLHSFDAVNNFRLFEQPFPVEVLEAEPLERFDLVDGVEAVVCKTPHTAESHAIRIEEPSGNSLVYSADTGFDESFAAFGRAAGLFILECTFFRDKPVKKHLELAEAMYLIRRSAPHRAMLTHFYPEWDSVDFAAEVKKFDPPCEIIEATDGSLIEF